MKPRLRARRQNAPQPHGTRRFNTSTGGFFEMDKKTYQMANELAARLYKASSKGKVHPSDGYDYGASQHHQEYHAFRMAMESMAFMASKEYEKHENHDIKETT